jgi:DNA-directed RNA polymerase subunit RPC12/RpoP
MIKYCLRCEREVNVRFQKGNLIGECERCGNKLYSLNNSDNKFKKIKRRETL